MSYIRTSPCILVVSSETRDERPIEADSEYKIIRKVIHEIIPCEFIPLASSTDFVEGLYKKNPTILHFSGHGKDGKIVLTNPNGGSEYKEHQWLLTVVENYISTEHQKLQCILLNACHTSSIAKILSKKKVYCIGIKGEIGNDEAYKFSKLFYGLVDKKGVINAFKAAMTTMPKCAKCFYNGEELLPNKKYPFLSDKIIGLDNNKKPIILIWLGLGLGVLLVVIVFMMFYMTGKGEVEETNELTFYVLDDDAKIIKAEAITKIQLVDKETYIDFTTNEDGFSLNINIPRNETNNQVFTIELFTVESEKIRRNFNLSGCDESHFFYSLNNPPRCIENQEAFLNEILSKQ